MKKVRVTIGILAMAVIALSATSCKEGNKNEPGMPMSNESYQPDLNADGEVVNEQNPSAILDEYISLKDALVEDNSEGAAESGAKLVSALNDFDVSSFPSGQQEELRDIIEDAKEHAEHIAESAMDHQREHFDTLSKDVIDLITITGTERTLYQDSCPMYNDNKGAQWLSATKEIKNPYYGSKMMTCGSVQKQIN